MCLMVIGVRTHRNFPITLGFNREEHPLRKASLPKLIADKSIEVAGVDGRSGGTWMGVNHFDLVVSLGNRSEKTKLKKPVSRGKLVVEALKLERPEKVTELIKKTVKEYAPFNIFYGNQNVSYVSIWNGTKLLTKKLESGHHVIYGDKVLDKKSALVKKIVHIMEEKKESEYLQEVQLNDSREIFFRLIQACRLYETEKDSLEKPKKKAALKKTVSSDLFALGNRGAKYSSLWHLTGNPIKGSYRDFSGHLRKISDPENRKTRVLK